MAGILGSKAFAGFRKAFCFASLPSLQDASLVYARGILSFQEAGARAHEPG